MDPEDEKRVNILERECHEFVARLRVLYSMKSDHPDFKHACQEALEDLGRLQLDLRAWQTLLTLISQ